MIAAWWLLLVLDDELRDIDKVAPGSVAQRLLLCSYKYRSTWICGFRDAASSAFFEILRSCVQPLDAYGYPVMKLVLRPQSGRELRTAMLAWEAGTSPTLPIFQILYFELNLNKTSSTNSRIIIQHFRG